MDQSLLREELARDEGRKLVAYQDTNGFWTIGVGHLLGTEQRMTKITDAECDALLTIDISNAVALVMEVFPLVKTAIGWGGSPFSDEEDVRLRALINMAFNRGNHMKTSTTITPAILTAMQDGNWAPVGVAIRQSPWATQIGARADRLAHMLETGTV